MSSAVFPTLTGQGWGINRTEIWDTTIAMNQSGKETRMANQTYQLHSWDLTFTALRQGRVHNSSYTEFAQLAGFYNQRQGCFDSFLYADNDDYTVTGQAIGTGDGSTLTFPLVRTFGGFVEPVLAPHTVATVYVDGVDQVGFWTVSNWGSATPGVITFSGGHAPTNAKAITADFTYYWPCRFLTDRISFNKFISNIYEGKSVSFVSIK